MPTKAMAFALGADDYLTKPVDPRELKMRVDAKLRKLGAKKLGATILKVGSLICNVEEQRLFCTGRDEPIELTSIEFRIFHLFAKAPTKILSRAEILERIWGNEADVNDRAVDVHISNLRKKLGDTGIGFAGVIGSGYRIKIEARA